MMRQQLGAVKELEELLDFDAKQEVDHNEIAQEDIALLKDHVDRLKRICQTATALSQYYQGLEKKSENDDSDSEVHVTEGTLKAAFDESVKDEKPKRIRTKKETKVDPVPKVVEDDDYDDLLG